MPRPKSKLHKKPNLAMPSLADPIDASINVADAYAKAPNTTNVPSGNTSFFNQKNINTGLQFLPDALNLATGLFGKDKTRPATQVNQRSVGMMPKTVNVNPQLRDIRSSYRAIIADPNASGAEKLAAQAQLNRATSDIYARKNNMETRMQSNQAQLQAELDSRQSQFDNQFREDKMASEANLGLSGNFARQALSSISSKYLQRKALEAKRNRDKQAFGAIVSSMPQAVQERLMKWYEE